MTRACEISAPRVCFPHPRCRRKAITPKGQRTRDMYGGHEERAQRQRKCHKDRDTHNKKRELGQIRISFHKSSDMDGKASQATDNLLSKSPLGYWAFMRHLCNSTHRIKASKQCCCKQSEHDSWNRRQHELVKHLTHLASHFLAQVGEVSDISYWLASHHRASLSVLCHTSCLVRMGVLQALTSVAFGFHGDAPISSAVSITSAHLSPLSGAYSSILQRV